MVVVRESPTAKLSPKTNGAAWPPRSTFEALLSSPSGRKKWQDQSNREAERSLSPSPVRKPLGSSKALQILSQPSDDEEDEDEDEEVLRLKLERIEATLKLKQLQKAKRKADTAESRGINSRPRSRPDEKSPSPDRTSRSPRSQRSPIRSAVEVPISPIKDRTEPSTQLSPARKRLGLDASLKGSDVSLKRARDGTQIKRPDNQTSREGNSTTATKISSFSERLARSKEASDEHRAKQERVQNSRSKSFAASAVTIPSGSRSKLGHRLSQRDPERPKSAGQTGASKDAAQDASLGRSASTHLARGRSPGKSLGRPSVGSRDQGNDLPSSLSKEHGAPANNTEQESSGFDPFSQIHLSKRHIPHVQVAREMENKELYTIPRLFKEVVSPFYDPPDCESDVVVFAILASKSNPFDKQQGHRTSDENKPQDDAQSSGNKFMVLHLTDLKWELDCFLFGTGFDQFWKLTPGTLLAILNPGIMPPKTNQHNGRFSLKLASCEDRVMEIGMARDLGYCASVRKDGQQCGEWIDKRRADICEFHLNLMIDRNRKHRMEVNSMWRGENKTEEVRKRRVKDNSAAGPGKKPRGSYHHEYGQLYSVPTAGTATTLGSTASLLDAEDTDALHNYSREEASRRRLAAAQKERDLAKKLGEIGNGLGAEYLLLRSRGAHSTASTTDISSSSSSDNNNNNNNRAFFEKPSASELGLLANRAADQRLSPAKDRRRHFGLGAVSSAGSEAVGWGGARKSNLLLPKSGGKVDEDASVVEQGVQTKLDDVQQQQQQQQQRRAGIVRSRSREERSFSPKKRARFALDKGIREPGRESLGGEDVRRRMHGGEQEMAGGLDHEDYDDDELDIV